MAGRLGTILSGVTEESKVREAKRLSCPQGWVCKAERMVGRRWMGRAMVIVQIWAGSQNVLESDEVKESSALLKVVPPLKAPLIRSR